MASFFVSRVDTEVDKRLDEIGTDEALALKGKVAVANAWRAYGAFEEVHRQRPLEAAGRRRRPPAAAAVGLDRRQEPRLPATRSTSTELVVADTVNTMPEKTLDAFADHGEVDGRQGHRPHRRGRQAVFDQLEAVGDRLRGRAGDLEHEGVDKFKKSWTELVETVKGQMEQAGSERRPRSTPPRTGAGRG